MMKAMKEYLVMARIVEKALRSGQQYIIISSRSIRNSMCHNKIFQASWGFLPFFSK